RSMLVNLVPEFLAVLAAPDPPAAYHDYLERHGPVLQSYWRNYVLDPTSPPAERVIAAALRAERADLERLLEDVDVAAIADEALGRSLEQFEADCPVDLYLMVGVGAANAGELVVGGRGIAFVCLEHFTGRANPQTYGMGLAPHLLPLWIAHEVAHAVPAPAHPRARRFSAARGGAAARRVGTGIAAALPVGGDERGGPDDGRPHAAGAVGLLPRPAAGGELPRRAGHRVDAARRDGRAPQGRGTRAGHAERMS